MCCICTSKRMNWHESLCHSFSSVYSSIVIYASLSTLPYMPSPLHPSFSRSRPIWRDQPRPPPPLVENPIFWMASISNSLAWWSSVYTKLAPPLQPPLQFVISAGSSSWLRPIRRPLIRAPDPLSCPLVTTRNQQTDWFIEGSQGGGHWGTGLLEGCGMMKRRAKIDEGTSMAWYADPPSISFLCNAIFGCRLYPPYSRKVKRFVWRMFMALAASRASMTQDMLISLAPKKIQARIFQPSSFRGPALHEGNLGGSLAVNT